MNLAKRTSYLNELREALVQDALDEGQNLATAEAFATEELTRFRIPNSYLRFLVKDLRWLRNHPLTS